MFDDADKCWFWVGQGQGGGWDYGRYQVWGKRWSAHTQAYRDAYGPIHDGMVVRHTCDVPRCVNPRHLLLGSQGDNNRDTWERNRHPGRRKLNAEQVAFVRANKGVFTGAQIGQRFGVSRSTIHAIWSGQNYGANGP